MDVIAVGDEHAPLAEEGLDKAEDRVKPEGKELGSERAALPCARAAVDDLWGEIVTPDVEFCGFTVIGPYPIPEAREAFTNDLQESAPMDGVESILGVESDVDP
jgi:hypothetical protein